MRDRDNPPPPERQAGRSAPLLIELPIAALEEMLDIAVAAMLQRRDQRRAGPAAYYQTDAAQLRLRTQISQIGHWLALALTFDELSALVHRVCANGGDDWGRRMSVLDSAFDGLVTVEGARWIA